MGGATRQRQSALVPAEHYALVKPLAVLENS